MINRSLNEDEIYNITEAFRMAILDAKYDRRFQYRDRMSNFPGGCCDDASDLLAYSAFNSTGLQELKKIADKYHQISNDFKIVEKDGKTEQYRDNENKTSDEEKNDKDTQ